jgi:hypothetical protein
MWSRTYVLIFMCGVIVFMAHRVRVQATNPDTEGRKLFLTHCAACHREDGRGQGPAAAAMKLPPADLTRISKRRKGQFPYDEIRNIISGLKLENVYGPRAMPVWGKVFAELGPTEHGRVNLLLMRLKSIQEQ